MDSVHHRRGLGDALRRVDDELPGDVRQPGQGDLQPERLRPHVHRPLASPHRRPLVGDRSVGPVFDEEHEPGYVQLQRQPDALVLRQGPSRQLHRGQPVNQRVLAIGAGAAVVVLLLWYFALWGPRNDALRKQRTRADAADKQVQTLKTQLSRLQAAQRAEPVKRAKLERLRAAIPDDPGLAQFILDANDAANRAGINFIS
ncbi:MAG: type II secretion system protein M, partial [Actinobacteria bacterium]